MKSPSKEFKKNIKDEEVLKYKEQDILQFAKLGKVEMINAIVKYHNLGMSVMTLTGLNDEFTYLKGE